MLFANDISDYCRNKCSCKFWNDDDEYCCKLEFKGIGKCPLKDFMNRLHEYCSSINISVSEIK